MIVVISGTNRQSSNSLKVARQIDGMLRANGRTSRLLDLAELPTGLFDPSAYGDKPAAFKPFQDTVFEAEGILTVVPEYNGSYPGALKLFIDMLQFPESLVETPTAFVGISAGRWGAMRAVEHLEMVFQYRSAHLYGRRLFIPGINNELDDNGAFCQAELRVRLEAMVHGFAEFCGAVSTDR